MALDTVDVLVNCKYPEPVVIVEQCQYIVIQLNIRLPFCCTINILSDTQAYTLFITNYGRYMSEIPWARKIIFFTCCPSSVCTEYEDNLGNNILCDVIFDFSAVIFSWFAVENVKYTSFPREP